MENARLSDIYDFQYGKGNTNPDNGGIYPVYGSNGIIGGYDKYNSEDSPVIGHIGANCGVVVFGKGKHFVTYNGVICKIKPGVDAKFGYYVLLASNLKRLGFGSAQPFVSYGDLNRVAIYLPKYETQVKYGKTLNDFDQLIENNNKRIKLLEQMAEEIYKEWFVRFRFPGYEEAEFENGIPKDWSVKKLKEVANILYGYSFDSSLFSDSNTDIPVVRIRDIPNGTTSTFTTEPCDKKYEIDINDILVGMDGIFHMTLWKEEKTYLNQRNLKIKAKENISQYYLYFSLYPQVKYWEQTISGTTVAHLGDKHINKMKIIIPRKDIIDKYNILADSIMNEIATLWKTNRNLIQQRDLLLPRLMSGKLEIKED